VLLYLKQVMGARIEDDGFLTLGDVAAIKKGGGLNNDWDLTDAIINTYLVNAVPPPPPDIPSHGELLSGIKDDRRVLQTLTSIAKGLDLSPLETLLQGRSVVELYASPSAGQSVRSPYLCNLGDVKSGNLSKRIFQEIYLGEELFGEIYGEVPLIYFGRGYVEQEKLIPSRFHLDELSDFCVLSIATGRPEVEAKNALTRFEIEKHFHALVTEDDVVSAELSASESLRKPHPFSLQLCMKRSGYTSTERVIYLGDMPDDMIAANRAGAEAVGFVNIRTRESEKEKRNHRVLLEESGASQVFGDFGEFTHFVRDL
jgi:hypothetical protein